jgi:hypothetical protein
MLKKMSNAGGNTIPNFKLYYRTIVIKIAWYWQKNRHEEEWKRIEDSDMNPGSNAFLIFDKGAKNLQWRKDSIFNKNYWENWIFACKKLKLDPCISTFIHVQVSTQSGLRTLI